MKHKCNFPGCDRAAVKGWRMCARHYSAGGTRKSHKHAQEQKAKRAHK